MRRVRAWMVVGLVVLLAVPALAAARGELGPAEVVVRVADVTVRTARHVVDAVARLLAGDEGAAVQTVARDGAVHWVGSVARDGSVEIRGTNGEVTARPASGDRVEVVARKQGRRSDPAEVRVEVVEHAGGVTVCAVYPTPRGEAPIRCAPGDGARLQVRNHDVRVDFEVRVPAGVALDIHTVNGDVQARDLDGEACVETVNGDIELVTAGFAEARTVNGSIRAFVGAAASADGLSFTTVNGSIELDLPDDVDADLHASWVNGGLTSDLPFQVEGVVSKRSARGTLGDGGPTLRLETVNGSIRIR